MKAVMISIRPEWVEKIISGEKTIEVRKTVPKIETPFRCFIYCTKAHKRRIVDSAFLYCADDLALVHAPYGVEIRNPYGSLGKDDELLNGKVVGEFTCDNVSEIKPHDDGYGATIEYNKCGKGSCLSFKQLNDYLNGGKGYAWHISDVKIYDKPKEISEFKKYSNCEFTDCEFNNECINCFEYSDILKSCSIDLHLTRPPQSWCYVENIEKE